MQDYDDHDRLPWLEEDAAPPEGVFVLPAIPEALRDGLYRQSVGRLRRRVRMRRGLYCAVIAGAYLAGAFTMGWGFRAGSGAVDLQATATEQSRDAPVQSAFSQPLDASEDLMIRLSAMSQEQQLEALQVTGDRYLLAAGDPRRAAQCYRRLLGMMPESSRYAITESDTWLLATLKLAKQKELNHVSSTI